MVNYAGAPKWLNRTFLAAPRCAWLPGSALDAAGAPRLPGDVADPMRAWSLHATKLVLIMGLRGGGDSLNAAATDLNTDATNVQMACALNGSHA